MPAMLLLYGVMGVSFFLATAGLVFLVARLKDV